MTLEMIYDCMRFDKAYIDTMLRHVETLLGGMVANPSALLDELMEFAGNSDRRRLI